MKDLVGLNRVPKLEEWKRLTDIDAVDFNENQVSDANLDPKNPTIKYMLDRKQSRRQTARIVTPKS
jgi:hypothetical protein